jgi:hypothetical protein
LARSALSFSGHAASLQAQRMSDLLVKVSQDTSIQQHKPHTQQRETSNKMQRQQFPSRLLPPTAFGMVSKHIYRSSYPTNRCLPFFQTLNLKTLM